MDANPDTSTPAMLSDLNHKEAALMRMRHIVDDARLEIEETLHNTGLTQERLAGIDGDGVANCGEEEFDEMLEAASLLFVLKDKLAAIDQPTVAPTPKRSDA